MFRHTLVVMGLIAAGTPAAPAAAQGDSLPAIGSRIRVVFPAANGQPDRYVVGRFVRLVGDSVVLLKGEGGLAAREDTATFSLGGRHVERQVASRGHGGTGAALGSVLGAIAGGAVGAASWKPCHQTGLFACMWYPSQSGQTTAGAVVGALGGALLGWMVGTSIRESIWAPVRNAGMHLTLTPRGIGIGIAF
jgi:hypothetical protein